MRVTFLYLTCLLTCGIISLSQAMQCSGSAKYTLTFKGEWTKESHPQDFPQRNNPHFSPVVGCSHNTSYVMWRPGKKATKGVQLVAERGRTGEINKEIDEQISLKTSLNKFEGAGISNVGTRIVTNVEVNTDYPLVSAISMIAPSPDWFLGVRDYSLCNTTTGKWVDKRVRYLPLYDSGTDSDKTFVHDGTITNPPVPIFLITKIPEDSMKNETLKPFATFTFEKTSESTSPTSRVSPTNQATATPTSKASSVQHLDSTSSQATVTSIMPRSTKGNLKFIVSSVLSSVMSHSVAATTTMKPSSSSIRSEASSVQHLGSGEATATSIMPRSTKGDQKFITSSVLSSVMSHSVAATTIMRPSSNSIRSEASSVQHLGSGEATATSIMPRSTKGDQKFIPSSVRSSVMSHSVAATTIMRPSSSTTGSEASSVQHLGVFVFLKLMILNLFFTNILN